MSKAGDVTSKYMETEKIQKKGKNKTELAQKPVREQAVSTQITCEAIATKDCENLANELCQKMMVMPAINWGSISGISKTISSKLKILN